MENMHHQNLPVKFGLNTSEEAISKPKIRSDPEDEKCLRKPKTIDTLNGHRYQQLINLNNALQITQPHWDMRYERVILENALSHFHRAGHHLNIEMRSATALTVFVSSSPF
ncbi:hypothetical protein CEXT_366961 [Caerostris extrusa]|uniref:Uncharacterized protein n=1 Tax=Caerostris extrusa TaxID=172846 RepID=A0AAV4REN9_CAEEX|nr:hypothetical protein CEXT_366961 [Caerostris extrusa]